MISLRKSVKCGGRQLRTSCRVSFLRKVRLMLRILNSINQILLNSVLPNISGQNVNTFVPLRRGNFVIMSTKLRFYIGEVLDIYKQAAGSRYGSVDDANSASSLSFLALRVYLPLQVQLVRNMPLSYHGY